MKFLLKNKEIIVLIIPSLRHGGAERVISILANHWAQDANLQVNLIVLTKQTKYYELDKRVTLIEPSRTYQNNAWSKFGYLLWSLKFIRQTVHKINPATVLSFCERYNNLVLMALTGFSYNVFVSDRNNPSNNIGILHERLRKLYYKKATGIIAQTSIGAAILLNKTRNTNITVIANPLREIQQFDAKPENMILNVGRNENQKNQLELIDIFSNLEKAENWKLYILGNGSLREAMWAKVQQYGLQDRIILLDFQADIDRYFQRASIFAFPSLYEGFPNALSEAMANGLPCVAYDCPTGPSEMIEDGVNGFLIPLKDKKLFLQKLQLLVNESEVRKNIGNEASKVKGKLAEENICNDYLNTILKR